MNFHEPVLLKESIDLLNINPDGIYIDCTFGGGGHSLEILKRLSPKGLLIAIDEDSDVLINLRKFNFPNFKFFNTNFRNVENIIKKLNIDKIDGLLADLGVSSFQLNTKERGFSFRYNDSLDMRMDKTQTIDAYHIINNSPIKKLQQIFKVYGELSNAGLLAKKIDWERRKNPIKTTFDIVDILKQYAPRFRENKFFAKLFQSIRIEVNQELENLKVLLEGTENLIKPEGRLIIISYHSLEDRLVKYFIKTGNFKNQYEKDFYGNIIRPFKPYKKFFKPTSEEVSNNNRARSAILRVGIKI